MPLQTRHVWFRKSEKAFRGKVFVTPNLRSKMVQPPIFGWGTGAAIIVLVEQTDIAQ